FLAAVDVAVPLNEFHRPDFNVEFGGEEAFASQKDAGAVDSIRGTKPPAEFHGLTGDGKRPGAPGTIRRAHHLATVDRNAKVELPLPDLAAFGVHILETLYERNRCITRGNGMAGIGDRSAEDDAEAFAVALVEITAALNQKISGIFQEGIVQGNVVVDRQRFRQFAVVEDFANEHGSLDAFAFEGERYVGVDELFESPVRNAVSKDRGDEPLAHSAFAPRVQDAAQDR